MKHDWASVDIEESVLGTLMLSFNAIDISTIKPEYFVTQKHRTIFEHMFKLWMDGKPVDAMTLIDSLRRAGVLDYLGGAEYPVNLLAKTVAPSSPAHVGMLRDMWQRRESEKALKEALVSLESGKPVVDIVNAFDNKALHITQDQKASVHINKSEDLDDVLHAMLNPKPNDCTPTSLPSLDQMIGGYRPQELIIIAGRPGMGKTAGLVTEQLDLARRGIPSLTFSMDMGRRQLWNRYYSQLSGIAVNEMERGRTFTGEEVEALRESRDQMSNLPFWIDSYPYRTVADVRMITRQMKMKHDIQVVFLDHIGKILPQKSETREQEVSKIAQALKAMSKEFDICIVPMVQLNRAVEMRADKKPMISDLRESGAIEQEADMILLYYRPEYYGMTQFPNSGIDARGKMEIIGGKIRNSSTGSKIFDFVGSQTLIRECAVAPTDVDIWSGYDAMGVM